jgi:hypothetical protein
LAFNGQLEAQAQTPGENVTPAPFLELPPEVATRLAEFLPHSFSRLSQRQPFQMAVIGRTWTDLSEEPSGTGPLEAFPGAFARELAKQFYYTGGVRLLGENGPAEEGDEARGPELALRYLGKQDVTIFTAADALGTFGSQAKPQMVLLSLGHEEAAWTCHSGRFQEALEDFLALAESQEIDVILIAPPLEAKPPFEVSWGLPRKFTAILRTTATKRGLPFVDLGDFSQILPLEPNVNDPATIFDTLTTAYASAFEAAARGEGGLHARLGELLFTGLTTTPKPSSYGASAKSLQWLKDGRIKATFELTNEGGEDLSVVHFPLVSARWQPADTSPSTLLPAGEETTIEVVYQAIGPQTARPSESASETLPLLIVAKGLAQVRDFNFESKPVAMTWDQETQFNVETDFVLKGSLANTSNRDLQGKWTATWAKQELQGELKLPAGASERLELKLSVPTDLEGIWRTGLPLTLTVEFGGDPFVFERQVELARNAGLRMPMPLSLEADSSTRLAPASPGLSVKADADPGMLFFTCLVDDVPLHDNPDDGIAWEWRINLDARTYGKRLSPGATRSILVRGGAADGEATVGGIAPWAFGSGYAAEFDAAEIEARLDSTLTGQRRITVSIPRSYLYLHEWAMGNGNSQLGLDMTLTLWRALNRRPSPEVDTEVFRLVHSSRHPDDAEGLAVLELAPEPTPRWTVLPD